MIQKYDLAVDAQANYMCYSSNSVMECMKNEVCGNSGEDRRDLLRK